MSEAAASAVVQPAVQKSIPPAIGLKPLVSEIALLLDFLTSRPNNSYRGNATLKVPEGCETHADILATYVGIADRARRDQPVADKEVSFLLEMLDYLGSLTNPVGGDSIAFSVLVADAQIRAWRCVSTVQSALLDRIGIRGPCPVAAGGVNGAVVDARSAFPSYVAIARKAIAWHVIYRGCLMVALILVGLISIDLYAMSSSVKVLGEYKKQTETMLTTIGTQEKITWEKNPPVNREAFYIYCPRRDVFKDHKPLDVAHYYVCSSWFDLEDKRNNAADALHATIKKSMTCSGLGWVFCRGLDEVPQASTRATPLLGPHLITDQAAATVIGQITFFLLAPAMSLLGALISVIRSHVNDIRERLLRPHSTQAKSARIVLGTSAGIVLSYFYAPGGQQAQQPDGLIAVANLTIPAVAFLVGASADFVFGKLEDLTTDLFKREPK